jgi:hypothetical protein
MSYYCAARPEIDEAAGVNAAIYIPAAIGRSCAKLSKLEEDCCSNKRPRGASQYAEKISFT